MRIIGQAILEAFKKVQPIVRPALDRWVLLVTAADWREFREVRQTFPSAEYIRGLICFDIASHRMITEVDFTAETVTVSQMMTHADYDKWSTAIRKIKKNKGKLT